MTAAVFLDRDGTINQEVGYIRSLPDLRLMPGAGRAISRLNAAGIPVILVTNQSGPARGYYPEAHVQALHERLQELLLEEGAILDDLYYCPHLPPEEGGTVSPYAVTCLCRKPGTGMVDDACARWNLDPRASYVVGDKASDVELGKACGARTVLLLSGYGERVLAGTYQHPVQADHVAADLPAAIDWILSDMRLG
ncbi:MAG: HAD family hydrolase [Candidatus Sericytochromatia bacterium]|nr:HAD family hydrolase [Candidatus Sericytochromatia bacterium]